MRRHREPPLGGVAIQNAAYALDWLPPGRFDVLMSYTRGIAGASAERPRDSLMRFPLTAAEIAFLLLAPIAAVIAFHISVINQAGQVDPEFYTGYGYSFSRMWREFGPTYYGIRFPVVFLNSIFQNLGHGLAGYDLLRLLLLWCAGIPLFLMTRRLYGAAIACVGYAFLFLNPLLPRAMLWDLTTFVSIPTALSGMAVWHLRARRTLLISTISGFLFCISVNSHAFTGTAIALFLLVEFGFNLGDPDARRHILQDVAGLVLGSAIGMALGFLFFWVHVGFVSPRTLWQVTLSAVALGHHYTTTHYLPVSKFFDINYDIYVPYITTAMAVVLLRSALLRNTIEARIAWFAILYCGAYAFAVVVLRMFIASTYFYLSHLALVSYLTVPVVLGCASPVSRRLRAGLFGLGLLLPLVIVRIDPAWAFHISQLFDGSAAAVLVIGLIALTAAILLLFTRRNAPAVAALFLFALVTQIPLLFEPYLEMYLDTSTRQVEVPLYKMIRQYQTLLNQYDGPGRRVRIWYRIDGGGLFLSLASTNLLYTVQDPWSAGPTPGTIANPKPGSGMPEIGPYERRTLADPETGYVLLVARTETRINQGLAALDAAGVKFQRVEQRLWGASPFTAHAVLVRIMRHAVKSARKLSETRKFALFLSRAE